MKKRLFNFLVAALAILMGGYSCSNGEVDLCHVEQFTKAKPVWAEGRESEKNLTLSFREIVDASFVGSAYIRIAASCNYRLTVNGEFVSHGPCVAAHDFYRIDCLDLEPYMKWGKNIIAIEVAGYNDDNYYLLNQPSFLQAEVELNGDVVAATGEQFKAYELGQRKQDVREFSFQRPYVEHYILSPDYRAWMMDAEWTPQVEPQKLVEQSAKTLIARHVDYPDYTIHQAQKMENGVYKYKSNSTGFIGAKLTVEEKAKIRFAFDELLSDDGHVNGSRFGCYCYLTYELEPGEYMLEAYEPNTGQYVEMYVDQGKATLHEIYMRDYCGNFQKAQFACDNENLNRLFEVARETLRQNALDIFMDCPSRERAGWLCDSYFTSRVAFDMAGDTKIEKNFLENFLLPEKHKYIMDGMLPMCYPSDHPNENFIPSWAMFYVLELEEYLHRTGDQALVDKAKKRVYDLVRFFEPYYNEDGLLESLPKWVFVEWSAANDFVQDVNYPNNMIFAEMLDVVDRLYGDKALAEKADKMREEIIRQSYNGEFFIDNAIRNKRTGKLELTNNITETCQYYAFHFNTVSPKSHPELWAKLRDKFGPVRKTNNEFPQVHPANAFIGNYLRLELLSREKLSAQILSECIDEYMIMAERTGTLWENMTPHASCNHGFASHIAHVLKRDVAGIYDVAPVEKKIYLRFIDSGLKQCKVSFPVGEDKIALEWSVENGTFDVRASIPEGYTCEVIPTSSEVNISME